ncbi:hypothetical protein H4R21_000226 [Coemansia helicoidea]|uniref:Uncharacterized protein n=1 Tax=Coemansia helicoidea TaxID=1286919 RepID=A0ACC1LG40_9FUNG|nr:hypothetical protein H4R21_000226 [Coemansia helicoidea]
MKVACLIAALCVIATSTHTMALPVAAEDAEAPDCDTTSTEAPKTPFEECVVKNGGQRFPYPGPGDCHTLGWCECLADGSVACVC